MAAAAVDPGKGYEHRQHSTAVETTVLSSGKDGALTMEASGTSTAARVDLRIATIGNVDSGKSTLVGVLTRNMLDDGAGKARSLVFTHKHEVETGRSSAVSVELMGFDGKAPVACNGDLRATRQKRWQEIRSHSERSVTFVDLCGHERYLKTTIYGLTALLPDYAMVLVGSNMGVARQTREHIGIAAALSLPIMVVVTKVDIAPPEVAKATMEQINKVLKQARRMPFVVRSSANVATAAKSISSDRITPIFHVSSVTGEGLDLLREMLALVPPRISVLAAKGEAFTLKGAVGGGLMDKAPVGGGPSTGADGEPRTPSATPAAGPAGGDQPQGLELGGSAAAGAAGVSPLGSSPARPATGAGGGAAAKAGGGAGGDSDADAAAGNSALQIGTSSTSSAAGPTGETCIDSVFNVPGVGTVVAGTVLKGAIHTGATMLLGPDRTGDWQPVTIRSIHVQYTPVEVALPGGSAAFAIRPKGKLKAGMDRRKPWVRKGMTLISPDAAPCSYYGFTAEILVLHHQTTMRTGYAPIVHTGVIAQCARIDSITSLDTGADISALRTGDRALVTFKWLFRPEYVKPGDVLLFREGRAKGVGRIKAVQHPHHPAATIGTD